MPESMQLGGVSVGQHIKCRAGSPENPVRALLLPSLRSCGTWWLPQVRTCWMACRATSSSSSSWLTANCSRQGRVVLMLVGCT